MNKQTQIIVCSVSAPSATQIPKATNIRKYIFGASDKFTYDTSETWASQHGWTLSSSIMGLMPGVKQYLHTAFPTSMIHRDAYFNLSTLHLKRLPSKRLFLTTQLPAVLSLHPIHFSTAPLLFMFTWVYFSTDYFPPKVVSITKSVFSTEPWHTFGTH